MRKTIPIIIASVCILLFSASLTLAQSKPVSAPEYGISPALIKANPYPDVEQLPPDDNLIFDRNYRRLLQAVDVYDAPEGNVIKSIAAGFNFVTAGSDENGWTQINPNEWVRSEFLGRALVSRFSGVFLPEELAYPMGWILVDVIPSRTPGAEPLATDAESTLYRYTRVNLFDYVEIDNWRWYQVGIDQWVHQTLIAKVIPIERPEDVDTERWISIDLYEQVIMAYEGDTPVFATLISSGLPQWSTNEGLFHVYVRYNRTIMSGAEGREDYYRLEEVPWTMYYDRDIGIHGTYWHDGFGYRHSHGCVNLSIMDAHWIFNWSTPEIDFNIPGDTGPVVYVFSSGDYV